MIKSSRIQGLQIARGIAAFCIAYFHSWVILLSFPKGTDSPIFILKQWGYLSIDFFFAISGYVICLVITKPEFNFGTFALKRFFRIYPVYWLCLVVYGATTFVRSEKPGETLGFFLYSATLLPTNGYPFYDIAWSLQHELVFYAIAGAVVPLLGLRGLVAILATSTVAAIWLNIPLHNLPLSKYHADFAAGVLAFMLAPRLRPSHGVLFGLVGLLLLVTLIKYSLLHSVAFFFLVAAAASLNFNYFVAKPLVRLGDVSYSLYVVHPLIFGIGYKVIGYLQPLPLWLQEPIRWGALLVCVVVSYLLWRLVERPTIALGERIAGRNSRNSDDAAGNLIPVDEHSFRR